MDQLMGLREELDLADPAAPSLDIEPRARAGRATGIVADAVRERANFADCSEVERLPPHERSDIVKESLARGHVLLPLLVPG